jgi:hypothetical protein
MILVSLLILLTFTLLNSQTKIKTIYNPSVETYKQLQNDYPTSLTCPCSTSTMPYKKFIIIETVMHQICSSDFVSQEWINAFHIPDAGRYGAIDFRTTANAQVNYCCKKYQFEYMFIVQSITKLMYIST